MKYEILRTTDKAILKVGLTFFVFLKRRREVVLYVSEE